MHVTDVERDGKKAVLFTVRNDSDLPIELQRVGDVIPAKAGIGPKELNLPPNTSTRVKINVSGAEEQIELTYTANNFLVAPQKGMPVQIRPRPRPHGGRQSRVVPAVRYSGASINAKPRSGERGLVFGGGR